MTVYIEKPAVNLREELASLRNQGGYEEQQFYLDSLVTNGTFDANVNGWMPAGGGLVTFDTGRLKLENTVVSNFGYSFQMFTTLVGKTYVVEVDFVGGGTSTSNFLQIGNAVTSTAYGNFSLGSATITKVATFTALTNTSQIRIASGITIGAYGFWDNISVFETDGTDVVHRLPKGWKPKDVFEDGLLQREGAANDYEVVYDGFDYYVKPTVAPSATTQTCVIGVKA